MVNKAAAGYGNFTNVTSTDRQFDVDFDSITEIFLEEVLWFLIYSIILGVVIWISTYLSVFLFNKSAQNQVQHISCFYYYLHIS